MMRRPVEVIDSDFRKREETVSPFSSAIAITFKTAT